jgi:hypothetical protein
LPDENDRANGKGPPLPDDPAGDLPGVQFNPNGGTVSSAEYAERLSGDIGDQNWA